MKNATYKLAYLVSHPIQYQAPLLRYLAAQPDIDLTVFFLSDVSMHSHTDQGFGTKIDWDVPLVEGYRHLFLPSWYGTQRLNFAEPMVRGLHNHLAGQDFDALWIHGWFHQVNLRAIRMARSIDLPVFMRGESLLHDTGWKARVKGMLQRKVLDNVDRFLAIGTRNAEFYRHHGVSDERIFHVPYAVDNDFFRERAEAAAFTREEYRAELNLEPGRPIILFASKFITRKRPMDLLKAYSSLAARGKQPIPYLLFVGSGEEEHNLHQAAWQCKMKSIRFLGFRNQTELPRLYDLCDVFVLPSDYEPWGLVLNEVMNAGRPIIASDCVGAAPDLIHEGQTGFTIPAGDINLLAARLQEVLQGDNSKRMGAASKRLIADWSFEADYRGIIAALESQRRGSVAA